MFEIIELLGNPFICGINLIALTFGIAYLIKYFMQGGKFTKDVTARKKVVIVTGSNTGIGKETVRELAKRGAIIYMACRNMKKAEEARKEIVLETKNKNIHCVKCDLSSLVSIRKFVEIFKKQQTKLHILINNAGVLSCPYTLTNEGFEMQLGVNHMGHFLLTNLLLEVMKQSAPSRIIVVSSQAHIMGQINVSDLNSEKSYGEGIAYAQSKLANILFSRELANRLAGSGVTVNALHPGVVDTEIFRHIRIFNNFLSDLIFKPLFWPFIKTTKNGAQTTLYTALDPDLTHVTGKYFSDCALKEVCKAAQDNAMARWLWLESEKWTNFKYE